MLALARRTVPPAADTLYSRDVPREQGVHPLSNYRSGVTCSRYAASERCLGDLGEAAANHHFGAGRSTRIAFGRLSEQAQGGPRPYIADVASVTHTSSSYVPDPNPRQSDRDSRRHTPGTARRYGPPFPPATARGGSPALPRLPDSPPASRPEDCCGSRVSARRNRAVPRGWITARDPVRARPRRGAATCRAIGRRDRPGRASYAGEGRAHAATGPGEQGPGTAPEGPRTRSQGGRGAGRARTGAARTGLPGPGERVPPGTGLTVTGPGETGAVERARKKR